MNIKFKSWLLIVSTLILGLMLGSLCTRYMYRIHHGEGRCKNSHGNYGHCKGMTGKYFKKGFALHKMEKHLKLSSDQKKSIEPILERHSLQFDNLIAESKSAFKGQLDALHEELRPLLSDKQNKKLEKMRKHMERRHHRKGKFHKGSHFEKDTNAYE